MVQVAAPLRLYSIQCQVEFEDIHARLTQKAELAPLRELVHQSPDNRLTQATCFCHARDLVEGCGDTDVRVKTRARGGNQIHRDGLGVGRIGGFQCGDAGFDRLQQGRVGRAEVGPGGSRGVIRIRSGGRKASPEIFRVVERLADQTRANSLAISDDQAAIGLTGKNEFERSR